MGLYLKLGFVPMRTAVYNSVPNDYALSLPLLREKMDARTFALFEERTR